jgi:hypothetical protein
MSASDNWASKGRETMGKKNEAEEGLRLRCYVCGKEIPHSGEFAVISPGTIAVDRVFVAHTGDCLAEIGEDQPSLVVRPS